MSATIDLATYKEALIVLTTAGVIVPIMHRLRLTPVLGYLAAGALLGPNGLGALAAGWPALGWITIGDERQIAGMAELGVVFLLFLIGLELSLQRLLTMRRLVFGLGGLQVLACAVAIGLTAPFFGNSPAASVLIGLSLALSSTAIVIEHLSQKRRINTVMGRASFSVLLFQDLAVVPILLLVGVLGTKPGENMIGGVVLALALAAAGIAAIVVLGRILLRPLFRLVAATESSELFVAATLLVAIGTGVLSASVGLSMSLGAFTVGLLLAETEYRKAIEATIEPFKGLLLGVFFISIGMKIDLVALVSQPLYVVACALGLVALKAALIAPLARAYGIAWPSALHMGLLLGPGGEFAFIVIGLATAAGIMTGDIGGLLLTVVALSMSAIPVFGLLGERLARSLEKAGEARGAELDAVPPEDIEPHAIVVGCGRVGELVAEMLRAHGVPHVVTERNPAAVARGRARGHDVFFGDAKNPLFLRRCGLATARALIITIRARGEIDDIIAVARGLRPELMIVSRARDADHARHLYAEGVSDAVPETIEASLQLSEAALVGIGIPTGPVIASIHDKRDEFRRQLQQATGTTARRIRGVRTSQRASAE
jgi:CPA2 family monovalent cation:H+ antiporter-2